MPSWQPENHFEPRSIHQQSDHHHDDQSFTPPDFPSPPASMIDEEHPTRASTWASNLRSTLFAAISGTGAMTGRGPDQEDKFTRSVLPLHRNSTKRSVMSTLSLTDDRAHTFPRRSFPMVIDEKDEQEFDSQLASRDKSRYEMSRDSSLVSAFSISGLPKAVTMEERYKTWSRSQRSMSAMSGESWSGVKAVMAGGERAKGVRGSMA